MGPIRNIADLISLIRRRFTLMAVIFILGTAATFMVVRKMPHSWESVAVLQVELPEVATGTGAAENAAQSAQRLQLLEQQLTSRDALLELAAKFGLDKAMAGLTPSQLIHVMRMSIRLEPVRGSQGMFGQLQPVSALIIRVTLGDRQKAADMANDIATRMVEGTSGQQSASVRETRAFYTAEETRISAEIAAVEAELTNFKNANIDALPEGLTTRRTTVLDLEAQMRELDSEIMQLRQELAPLRSRENPRVVEQRRIDALNSQIGDLLIRRDQLETRHDEVAAAIARTPTVDTGIGNYLRRLQQLQDQYSVINRRRAEAETSQRLDAEHQTERFALLEAALPADFPQASGRRKRMVMGAGAAGGLALLVALLLDMRRPVLRSARNMEASLKLRPVIALPDLGTPRRSRRQPKPEA